jgi:hypothetical protein
VPDYRLEIDTPTGGEVAFHRGADAADVAAYARREGWLLDHPLVATTPKLIGFCANCVERCEGQHGPCFSEEIGCTEDFRPTDVATAPSLADGGGHA